MLNAYLLGGCMSRPWDEVEADIASLELTFEQLEAMGLEYLFPGVIVLPPFGAKEEAEAVAAAAAAEDAANERKAKGGQGAGRRREPDVDDEDGGEEEETVDRRRKAHDEL